MASRWIRQRNSYTCGPVAIMNLLKWLGEPTSYAKDFEYWKNFNYDTYKETYVKVIVINKQNPYLFENMLDNLYKANVATISGYLTGNIPSDKTEINNLKNQNENMLILILIRHSSLMWISMLHHMAKVLRNRILRALFCHQKSFSLLSCLLAFLPFGIHAQTTWPTRAVTIVVPFTPGGGTDVGTRVVAQRLSQLWGQPVLVENRAGAGGNVGLEAVSRAKPDGYTLLTGNVGTQSINPTLYKKLNYNPDTSFTPISLIAELPFAMVVTPTLPVKTPQDLVALSKAQPNLLSYASSGAGGSPHLSMETFKIATGAKIQHVPYKGGSAAITDLMSGNVQVLMVSILETSAYVKAGKLKGLAVTSKARSPAMPDVPTMVESGITGAESGSWIGFLAPQGTPKDIIDKIAAGVKEVVAMPEVSQQLIAQGAVPMSSTPAQFAELIANDRKRYARIITDNQLTAD